MSIVTQFINTFSIVQIVDQQSGKNSLLAREGGFGEVGHNSVIDVCVFMAVVILIQCVEKMRFFVKV